MRRDDGLVFMDPAEVDDVATETDGVMAGTVDIPDGGSLPVTLDAELVERAQENGVDVDRLRSAAVGDVGTVDLSAQTDGDNSATVPVQDNRQTDLTSRLRNDRRHQFIGDDQIQRLIENGVNYTERIGEWLLEEDDLIPTVKERLKALIVGQDGIQPEPVNPDSDADQRLTDVLEERYHDDVRPTEVIDTILRENFMNARAVLRSTDLKELDLRTLDYLRDGVSGEEIYIQDQTTVYEFDIGDQADDSDDRDNIPEFSLDQTTIEPQPLVIGEHVFDISLYDSPPLEAVVDTAVNKMVMQRLKARKAEITSFGAVYATVEPPEYLPEEQYFDRVADEDWNQEKDGQPPTKLERAMKQDIQGAFDTLKDFQSGTVMSVPSHWSLEQLELPDNSEPLDDQIRGYNRDISRRLLVPLDLIELQSGSELSRETMFATLMTTIAGWRREIKRVFDNYADTVAEIEGINGDVEHQFPALKDADTQNIISALQYAGIGGLSEKEVRQMMNAIQGVDLDTDREPDDMPSDGGPDDPQKRTQQMDQFLDDQQRGPQDPAGPQDGLDDQPGQQGGPDDATAAAVEGATQTLRAAVGQVRSEGDADIDFDLDFPPHLTPSKDSRVDIQERKTVASGRLALPPVPSAGIERSNLREQIRSMLWGLVDIDATDVMEVRVADDPPNHQPYIDIVDDLKVDALRTVAQELPDQYMTLYDNITAQDTGSDGQGNRNPDGDAGQADQLLKSVPYLPNPSDDGVTITKDHLANWYAWVKSGRPPLTGAWNPALHPRGPDGKFVERPYDIPDSLVSEIRSSSGPELLQKLVENDELGLDDIDAILQDPNVRVDDVADDLNNYNELRNQINRGGTAMRPNLDQIDTPDSNLDDEDDPAWKSRSDISGTIKEGDVVAYRTDDVLADREVRKGKVVDTGGFNDPTVIETPDGERIEDPGGDRGGIFGVYQPGDRDQPTDDDLVEDPGLMDVSDDDPRFTKNFNDEALEPGDIVRVDTANDGVKVGEVATEPGSRGRVGVETQDGDFVRPYLDDDTGSNQITSVLDLGDTDEAITADDFITSTPDDVVDVTSLSGTPADRRGQIDSGEVLVDQEVTADMVANEEIPVGAFVVEESDLGTFAYRVTGYEERPFSDEKEIKLEGWSGTDTSYAPDRAEDKGLKPYKPRPEVTATINGWGDDSTSIRDRREAVKATLDQTLPKQPDHPDGDGSLEISDEQFEQVKERIADHLARSKDRENAEKIIANLMYVGDQKSRASATPSTGPEWKPNRGGFQIEDMEGTDERTQIHELGHVAGYVNGFISGSNDKDGESHPITEFDFSDGDDSVAQKYGIPALPGSDQYVSDESRKDQPMHMDGDDWKDDVRENIPTALDGRNFSSIKNRDNDDVREDLSSGGMIRFEDAAAYDEPQNFQIVDVDGPEDYSDQRITVEDRDGNRQTGVIRTSGGKLQLSWDRDSDYIAYNDIQGIRKSTPDGWRDNTPEADEVLGSADVDEPLEDKWNRLADRVNRSWWRQAVAGDQLDPDEAAKYTIDSGYSSKQAHETMSRIHEVMRNEGVTANKRAEHAQTLIKHHPDLVEAYRSVYDIPLEMKAGMNEVLEQEGHDFRFDGVPTMTAGPDREVARKVREMYGDD